MGSFRLLLCAAVLIAAYVEMSSAAGGCPPPSKIYDYTKKETCRSDGECRGGKICCLNPARVRSCTIPDPHGGSDKGSQSSSAVICENVKCQPYEVCKPDPANPRRKKCQRP